MPIQHAIWQVGDKPSPLQPGRLASEQLLEEMIVKEPRILSSEWMLIGRQETTSHGGRIDLLAIAPDGSLVLIELKRDKTPRDIIAQALDYASWVENLTADRLAQIYQRFSGGGKLDEAFRAHFRFDLDEDTLNQSHQVILVAAELDDSTERIINYLNARDIAINVVFFQVFEHGSQQLLSRAWLIDPRETQSNVSATSKSSGEKEPWNGEYCVSFGPADYRSWEDALNYGYVSAGGGSWYSQTLKLLAPGDRIWVKIPKSGYVGVGVVKGSVTPIRDLVVGSPQGEVAAIDVVKHADEYKQRADDPETAEYAVPVDWVQTVSESSAVWETGFFGNQNTVCQPTTPKWRHTVERLKTYFTDWNRPLSKS